jgi:hypothetical protein
VRGISHGDGMAWRSCSTALASVDSMGSQGSSRNGLGVAGLSE